MTIKTALEYQNKEQKEIKEKKSEGDDNVWGHYTNCYSFARIVALIPFFLVLLSFQVSLKCIYRSSKNKKVTEVIYEPFVAVFNQKPANVATGTGCCKT